MESRGAVALVLSVALPAMPQACDPDKDNLNFESWLDKEVVVICLGIITAIVLLVLVSLPVCCGVMKENKHLKPIAIAVGIFGVLCLLWPLLTSFTFSSMAVNDFCDRCLAFCEASREAGCTISRFTRCQWSDLMSDARFDSSFDFRRDCSIYSNPTCQDEQQRQWSKLLFAFYFATNAEAYTADSGSYATESVRINPFFVCLNLFIVPLSIVGMSLSCCICCPCCGPLLAYKKQQEGERGAAQETAALVGQPASS